MSHLAPTRLPKPSSPYATGCRILTRFRPMWLWSRTAKRAAFRWCSPKLTDLHCVLSRPSRPGAKNAAHFGRSVGRGIKAVAAKRVTAQNSRGAEPECTAGFVFCKSVRSIIRAARRVPATGAQKIERGRQAALIKPQRAPKQYF